MHIMLTNKVKISVWVRAGTQLQTSPSNACLLLYIKGSNLYAELSPCRVHLYNIIETRTCDTASNLPAQLCRKGAGLIGYVYYSNIAEFSY